MHRIISRQSYILHNLGFARICVLAVLLYLCLVGSLVGAYFIAKQMPYEGPGVYYDILTSAGGAFIDPRAMLRSVGLGAC